MIGWLIGGIIWIMGGLIVFLNQNLNPQWAPVIVPIYLIMAIIWFAIAGITARDSM